MENVKNRRNIEQSTIDKVVSELNPSFIEGLPENPTDIAREYATRIITPYFSSSINEKLKRMMIEHRLSDEDYLKTFFKIAYHTFHNATPTEQPRAFILLSQTGGGKSNLRERTLRENQGVVVLDSDAYKKFRPDSKKIQQQYPQYFGALTGIDCYDQLENIFRLTTDYGYNFLIESAPSVTQGIIGVNVEQLKAKGYEINYSVLAIGDMVSKMAVHKRYEEELRDSVRSKSAKLTDLGRHNDSYMAVTMILTKADENDTIKLFRRGIEEEDRVPQIIPSEKPIEEIISTLEENRAISNRNYIKSGQFEEDYIMVYGMMQERNAPEIQRIQLESVLQNAKLNMMQMLDQITQNNEEQADDIDK